MNTWYSPTHSIPLTPSQSSSFSEETTDAHRMVHQMSMSLTTKGLLNPTGENNCFLNSAVQVYKEIYSVLLYLCYCFTANVFNSKVSIVTYM